MFISRDGRFNQQSVVPELWRADNKSNAVHEVLPHQSGWAAGREAGADAPQLQASRRWGAMQKLHTLEAAVPDRVSRGWDTRGCCALLR